MPRNPRSTIYSNAIGSSRGAGSINRSYDFVNANNGGQGPAFFWNNYVERNQQQLPIPSPPVQTDKILIITCIDYRLMDEVVIALNQLGFNNLYDQFILAGASLGFNYGTVDSSLVPLSDNYWQQTFYDNVDIAISLHHIKQIFLIDHCDCGAYEAFYNVEFDNCGDPVSLERHYDNLALAASTITEKYKDTYGVGEGITVKKYIMELNGVMVEIP